MQEQQASIVFDKNLASSYDKQFEKIAPIRDALHLLMRMALSELPADARILCVGVGTGAELIELALAYPHWQFTAVEPAAAMLDVCRQRTKDLGIDKRCEFHQGYLDSLPEGPLFDAATSILVSHFIMQQPLRQDFFQQIHVRLKTGGYLLNVDLAAPISDAAYQDLLKVWRRTLAHTGMPDNKVEEILASYSREISVLPVPELQSLIELSGFSAPRMFFQAVLMCGWISQRADVNRIEGDFLR